MNKASSESSEAVTWEKQQAMNFFSEILYMGDICRVQKSFSESAVSFSNSKYIY